MTLSTFDTYKGVHTRSFPFVSAGGFQLTLMESEEVAVACMDKGGPLGAKF